MSRAELLAAIWFRLVSATATMLTCWAVAGTFSYAGIGDRAQEISINPDDGKIVIGHHGESATFCSSGDLFCFKSDEIAFAVPRTFGQTAQPSKWTYSGKHFVASGSAQDIRILGITLRLYSIDVPDASPPLRYWYDVERGLVAIQGLPSNSPILLLTEECGFGARLNCPTRSGQR